MDSLYLCLSQGKKQQLYETGNHRPEEGEMTRQAKRASPSRCTPCPTVWLSLLFPTFNWIRNSVYVSWRGAWKDQGEARAKPVLLDWNRRFAVCTQGFNKAQAEKQRNRCRAYGKGGTHPPSFLALSTETAGNNRYTWAQILVSKCDSPRTLILKKVTGSRAGAEKYRMSLVVQKVRK